MCMVSVCVSEGQLHLAGGWQTRLSWMGSPCYGWGTAWAARAQAWKPCHIEGERVHGEEPRLITTQAGLEHHPRLHSDFQSVCHPRHSCAALAVDSETPTLLAVGFGIPTAPH